MFAGGAQWHAFESGGENQTLNWLVDTRSSAAMLDAGCVLEYAPGDRVGSAYTCARWGLLVYCACHVCFVNMHVDGQKWRLGRQYALAALQTVDTRPRAHAPLHAARWSAL
jgi:hypothetical protein